MDVFEFRNNLVEDYEKFSRSFTTIKSEDIKNFVQDEYRSQKFWPAPLIQLNPNFVSGGPVEELVERNLLEPECSKIFRAKSEDDEFGKAMSLHQHQVEAIMVAKRNESYVLTTGTDSGKSLSYFIPIVDDVLKRKANKSYTAGISAIVVYPMNALCNSQLEELEKYLRLGYGEGKEPVTFARYTGQEDDAERDRISKNPPDILLTNYVMLELLMTRFMETDKAVRKHAQGLRFLVLDELHTYRGRQGADVAMLVRRVRERFNTNLLCIGTSATMASEGSTEDRNKVVANIASKLFGVLVKPENIITETLEPVTKLSTHLTVESLAQTINNGIINNLNFEELTSHPIAIWVERNLGLEEREGKFVRISRPKTLLEAAEKLAADSGLNVEKCKNYLEQFLLSAYNLKNEKGKSFFAFRLHQFISGAGNVYSTLEDINERYLTLEGQQYKPGSRDHLLFPLCFCRHCGQEYFPVWATMMNKNHPHQFSPRELSERSNENDEIKFGYIMPDSQGIFNGDDLEEKYPEEWLEIHNGLIRLKPYFKKFQPKPIGVSTTGTNLGDGMQGWFIPSTFRFCLNCGVHYDGSIRSELTKLSGLSSEGRSSATTVLTLSSLKYLIGTDLDDKAKKILGFTDNRQDASLQAGHFNDFIQILLLRGALLAAVRNEPGNILTDDILTQRVFDNLNLQPEDYSANPSEKGIKAQTKLKTLRDVLGYRLYFDLQRGWRYTSPNLEQLELLKIQYIGLMECCQDEEEWQKCESPVSTLTPHQRYKLVHELLDQMRKNLCIKTIYLDSNFQETVRNRSYNDLKEPWGLSEEEKMYSCAYMIPRTRPKKQKYNYPVVFVSYRSRFGRLVKKIWGLDNPNSPKKIDENLYNCIVDDLLKVLLTYGYVEETEIENNIAYRLDATPLVWSLSEDTESKLTGSINTFFKNLYENVANMLQGKDRFLHQLEAREHTAQVDADIRVQREARFRRGLVPKTASKNAEGLPVLFCSPTMELGVDISTLNTVYMRNVPPTPANYAQRSGRAGRSGQPALVITYCAARSPHDQYFFADPTRMVAGAVNPPTIDLTNEELVRSHLQAVWLAETGVKLGSSVREVIDLENNEELPLRSIIFKEMCKESVKDEAQRRSQHILSMLQEDLTSSSNTWYSENWLEHVIKGVTKRFDLAFRRWRSLYKATSNQMKVANETLHNAAATEQDRKEAKARYDEAFTQQNLLLETRPSVNSDFYTYRYLASEGFLPGYNFPRLPLMAFIPGRRERVVRDGFLSRPRFLGLSEFGPQSIIYHEGSTYRVKRAILTIRDENNISTSSNLPVHKAKLCPNCGYGHFSDERLFEICVNCGSDLKEGRELQNLYRIEQVSTRRATRITSDEEERQRQGYEMITTIRYSKENNKLRYDEIFFEEENEQLMKLRYAPAATIWRINLGWKRRTDKSIYGFSIDSNTGEWTSDSQAPDDMKDENTTEGKNVQRITPFVEDTKNVLMIQPMIPLSETSLVTLQYALKRGIESVFQLEESELGVEPLPDLTNRNAILFYEAAEGGAGVLTKLATDPSALPIVVKKALEICHYSNISGEWRGKDDLHDDESSCEAGCYRCLLSYYNQPEHALIDRKDSDTLNVLTRLIRAKGNKTNSNQNQGDSLEELKNASTSSLEEKWLQYLKDNNYRLPDTAHPLLRDFNTRPDFAYRDDQTLIYIDGPHHENEDQKNIDKEQTRQLEIAGLTVIRFPKEVSKWHEIISEHRWLFGDGIRLNEENQI